MNAFFAAWFLAMVPVLAYPEPQGAKPSADSLAAKYQLTASRIITAALAGNDGYRKLEDLCLTIGHRLSGSPQLEKAIDWAMAEMKKDGHESVRREKVMVPHWVRGRESATMLEPRAEELHMLGLGGSVGTPPEGITAEVLVVASKEELDAAGDKAKGKIVLFNNVMPPYDPQTGSGYGKAVHFRGRGAIYAAEKGAVACLVRSVTAKSLRSPHTGGMGYRDAPVKIPAAAISVEDADTIARLQAKGVKVVVNLKMEAKSLPDAESANVVGELRGSTLPDEIVIISGHLDSWDVGHGAHDDGGGCVMAMEAINVLRKLKLTPKRTIRVVLWTNEENGLAGGKTYAADHESELPKHVAAIESDSGVFTPTGYSLECLDKDREAVALEQMHDIARLLTSIGPMNIDTGHSGADVGAMKPGGVILMGHSVEGSTYFDYHHTFADTIDKIDAKKLDQNIAVMAVVAYVLADMPVRLGEIPVPSSP